MNSILFNLFIAAFFVLPLAVITLRLLIKLKGHANNVRLDLFGLQLGLTGIGSLQLFAYIFASTFWLYLGLFLLLLGLLCGLAGILDKSNRSA